MHHENDPPDRAPTNEGGSDLTGLSPRLRQTLACLLEGATEKGAAARLGVSRSTLHQYVKGLYRHFGVSSRAELMAYFLRQSRTRDDVDRP